MADIAAVEHGRIFVAGDDEHGLVVIAIGNVDPVGVDPDVAREIAAMLFAEADKVDAQKAARKARAN